MERFGRYELVARLGKGGMAEVFLARLGEGDTAKHLAIKRLLPGFGESPRLVQRLIDEARLCVWLSHPNIVQVFDFGRVDDSYFIAMEYVDGCDLQALLSPSSEPSLQLPMEVALELGFRVVDALRYAHSCTDSDGRPLGIIHRDVSPQNILIGRDGHPKLADFGVARAAFEMRDHTVPGIVLGKYSYMPPEQARGGACDRRVDLYAAGATLYQMLTGTRPFVDRAEQSAAQWAVLPAPPSNFRSSIPQSLDALILRAMAPRPDDRFSSADELGAALLQELAAAGGPPKPHQLGTLVARVLRHRRRGKWPACSSRVTPLDFTGEASLIARDVTQVRELHDVFDDLPVVELVEDTIPPAEPLVVVSPPASLPDTDVDGLMPPADEPSLSEAGAERTGAEHQLTDPWGVRPPRFARAWRTLRGAVGRLARLDWASWAVLAAAGLLMLLVGLCLGSSAR